jgi:hypothetical protein
VVVEKTPADRKKIQDVLTVHHVLLIFSSFESRINVRFAATDN